MGIGKADIKAIRERCGISQDFAAEAMGVRRMAVKRWENPKYNDPPEEYVEWLERFEASFDGKVAEMCEIARTSGADEVSLMYYRTQEGYEASHGDGGRFEQSNAMSRAVAERLSADGYKVSFAYPEDVPQDGE